MELAESLDGDIDTAFNNYREEIAETEPETKQRAPIMKIKPGSPLKH